MYVWYGTIVVVVSSDVFCCWHEVFSETIVSGLPKHGGIYQQNNNNFFTTPPVVSSNHSHWYHTTNTTSFNTTNNNTMKRIRKMAGATRNRLWRRSVQHETQRLDPAVRAALVDDVATATQPNDGGHTATIAGTRR